MKIHLLRSVMLIASLFVCSTSRASLIGDTITTTGAATGPILTPGSATIGPGIEFTGAQGRLEFDFGENTLTLIPEPSLIGGSGANAFQVFSGFDDTITGISIGSNLGWSGTILNPTFGPHSITLDFSSVQISATAPAPRTLVFNIQSIPTVSDHGVTAAMLGIALAGLAAARRKLRC